MKSSCWLFREGSLKVHCLYRDFFLFLRMISLEKDIWTAFRRHYFDKHRDFLKEVWFSYQKYTPKNIRERVTDIKREDYAAIESELKIFDIEENTREIILHCKGMLHDPDPCNVYLFIGFFSPDGFVILYNGEHVICVGLERFRNFKNYDVLLSHEYYHYILNKQCPRRRESLRNDLVREGLCIYFSKIAFPGRKEHLYLFLNEEQFSGLERNAGALMSKVKGGRLRREELFGSHSRQFPPRAGYYLGYRLVKDFIERTGIDDIGFLMREQNQILQT